MDTIQNAAFLIIGAVIGWLTNYFFYQRSDKKANLVNQPLEERTDEILLMLLQNRLEARWGKKLEERIVATEIPKDTDVPHILHFHVTASNPKQGETVGVFFRVADSGMNQGYLEVTEVSSQVRIPTTREGHGYYSCQVTFPKNLILGLYKVEFKLADSVGKKNSQFLEFDVVSV